ncbi:MAG: hypothetical protein PHW25_21315 [Zoogloea sp.]|uniref:hypothetical protein n=1 Tax=Zoogloea sp. TaxID=49181 RepID=UPI0026326A12|nr:hypothetical protein [Zoogloea sp.]MDD3329626.1 hypothetical protein [Zoogloea sp.]
MPVYFPGNGLPAGVKPVGVKTLLDGMGGIPVVGEKYGAPIPLVSSALDAPTRNVPPGLPPLPMQLIGAQGSYIVAAPNDAITAMQQYHASKYNVAVYYLKPSTGDDSNDGLTPATPFATVAKAIRTATGAASRVVVLEDSVLPTFDLRSTDASQTAEQIKILDGNGFDVVVKESGPDLSALSWTQDATYPECWTTTLALTGSAACAGVLFKGAVDERGRWLPLKSYASIAALDADSAGYFYNSETKALTVKIFGNSVRSQRGQLVGLFKNTSGTARILISGAKLGLANIRTIGVNLTMIDAAGRRPELWMHNSQVTWSTSKGLDMTQAGWFVASDVEFYSAGGDCANGFAPSVTGKGLIHDLRCRWSRGGDLRVFADNGTMQGISAHGGCDHVSWGSVYELNNGQGVADTCSNNYQDVSWLAACEFRRQARASPSMEFGSAASNASRKVYLDSCVSRGAAGADLVIGANATVFTYKTPLAIVTGGTALSFDPGSPS